MKIEEAKKWFSENGIDTATMQAQINWIKENLKKNRMAWQSVSLKFGDEKKVKIVPFGYRKHTTGEYVPKSYLCHFGWKNTYYQPAENNIYYY